MGDAIGGAPQCDRPEMKKHNILSSLLVLEPGSVTTVQWGPSALCIYQGCCFPSWVLDPDGKAECVLTGICLDVRWALGLVFFIAGLESHFANALRAGSKKKVFEAPTWTGICV